MKTVFVSVFLLFWVVKYLISERVLATGLFHTPLMEASTGTCFPESG
jgi:hypothetical protein